MLDQLVKGLIDQTSLKSGGSVSRETVVLHWGREGGGV